MRGDADFTRTMACGNTYKEASACCEVIHRRRHAHTHRNIHTHTHTETYTHTHKHKHTARRVTRAIIRSFCGRKNCHRKEQIINSPFSVTARTTHQEENRETETFLLYDNVHIYTASAHTYCTVYARAVANARVPRPRTLRSSPIALSALYVFTL